MATDVHRPVSPKATEAVPTTRAAQAAHVAAQTVQAVHVEG